MNTRYVIPPRPPVRPTVATSSGINFNEGPINVEASGTAPVLLLPVRIETRFVDSADKSELWLRIYPDQIAIDSHDQTLTKDEWAAAQQYWQAMWGVLQTDVDQQHAAWAALASPFGPKRAAYVAQVTAPPEFEPWIEGPAPGQPATPLGDGAPLQLVPPTTLRDTSWENPAYARALPEAWFVMLLVGGVPVHGIQVNRPGGDLVVSLAPPATPPASSPTSPTMGQDEMQWMFDFKAAEDAGMAVRIGLTPDQRKYGFDQVVVLGIAAGDPNAGKQMFESLLTAHRFTDGFALVAQGSPTKNSADSAAGYSRRDETYAQSFAVERRAPLIDVNTRIQTDLRDGHFFADALGIDRGLLTHTEHANGMDQQDAMNMATALWSATGAYFVGYILGYRGQIPLGDLQQFATRVVRGRGPIPAFRVGKTPYGILPAMTIKKPIEAGGWSRFLSVAARLINAALPVWLKSVEDPSASGKAPDQIVATVLTTDASTCRVNAAWCFGQLLMWNLAEFDRESIDDILRGLGNIYLNGYMSSLSALAAQTASLGWPPVPGLLRGLVLQMLYAFDLKLVTTGDPVSEVDPLPDSYGPQMNYLQYFEAQTVTKLLANGYLGGETTLLFRLLLQAVLLEYAFVAGTVLKTPLVDPEYFELKQGPATETFLSALTTKDYPVPAGGPPADGLTLGDYIQSQLSTPQGQQNYPTLAALFAALRALAPRPTAALQRAFTEALDIWTYRLDAWWTGIATSTLLHQRIEQHTGVFVGVYGYVESLAPAPRPVPLTPDQLAALAAAGLAGPGTNLPDPVQPPVDNGGFIYAPSITQAVTGAVLRNGYLTHVAGGPGPACSVDLSSSAVRKAAFLMEGVKQGQHLGALLGYQFEYNLMTNNLAQYISPFRQLYPVVANKLTGSGPAESVAASHVVDGAALQLAWVAGTIPWGGSLPSVGSTDYQGVANALNELNSAVDAVSDVSMAESVFQAVRGSPARSGGALDASSRDQHAAEPQVIETPRGGLDFTQRILSVFRTDPAAPPSSAWLLGLAGTPRSAAEPYLEQWLAAVLPAPDEVQFEVTYTLPPDPNPVSVGLTLADAAMSSLDFLALTPASGDPNAPALSGGELTGSQLERWIIAQCVLTTGTIPAGATQISISYGRGAVPNAPVTLPELLLLARSLRELLGTARPLTAKELVPAALQADLPGANVSEAGSRMEAAWIDFDALKTSLDTELKNIAQGMAANPPAPPTSHDADTLSQLLLTACAFGDPGAAPVTTERDNDSIAAIVAQAKVVQGRIASRWNTMYSDPNLFDQATHAILFNGANVPISTLRLAAKDLFGADFLLVMTYTPAAGDSLSKSLADAATAVAAWRNLATADRLDAPLVLQQMTHVRPAVARIDEVVNLSSLLLSLAANEQVPVPDWDVAQLPYDPLVPWLGTGAPPGQFPWDRSLQGKCALLTWTPGDLGAAAGPAICGLYFDEWVEQIPNDSERTGVALHYQEPGTRAPQTLVLAVCPPATRMWSLQTLVDTVLETMSYAKVRTVDPESLKGLGQLFPGIYTAFNVGGLTISTEFNELSSS